MNKVWCVVLALLSSFTLTEGSNGAAGGGGSVSACESIPSSLSRNNKYLSANASCCCIELGTVATTLSPRKGTGSGSHSSKSEANRVSSLLRGGAAAATFNLFPAGYNPFGYGLTDLGRTFLDFDGSIDSDVGRFLSTLKGGGEGKRKSASVLKDQWLEIVRVSKTGQSMRIYRRLDDLIEFCLTAGFMD